VPLVEAMAYGIPVVAWPAGAVPYTLGRAGVLLPDRTPATVAAALLRIARDPAVRTAIVTRQQQVLDRFRLDRQAPHLIQALATAGAAPPLEEFSRRELLANAHFTVMGHVNKTYSLSSVNRQMALALEARRPGTVRVVPIEGAPTTDISEVPPWHVRQIGELVDRPVPSTGPEIVISQHYPIYVPEHRGDLTAAMVFWEESLLPAATIRALNDHFDALLAPSNQVAKALIDSGLSIPVRVVGFAPELEAFYRLGTERDARGRDIGQPVTFLHVSSCFPRKGVDVLLSAYAKAFRNGESVRLVIKGFPNPHNDVPEQIERLRRRVPDLAEIIMINDDLDDTGMHDLYRQADAMVLPTRGEGFNIPAAEAMAAAIPLIVTGQGGHLDFCTSEDARLVDYHLAPSSSHLATPGSVWQEPDLDDLTIALRDVFDDITNVGGPSAIRAARARAVVRERLDPDHWADRMAAAAVEMLTQPALPRLRVAWVSTWAVRCGIAEYSRALVEGFAQSHRNRSALSTLILCDDRTAAGLDGDGLRVHPSWSLGETGGMERLVRTVANDDSDAVVIQYQPGLFDWHALAAFVSDPRIRSRVTVVTLHAAQRLFDIDVAERTPVVTALGGVSRILVHRVADLEFLKGYGLTANVTLIPQGAPRRVGSSTASPLSDTDAPLIGCYGFFLPGKGIGRLIQAVAQLHRNWPSVRLRLVNAEYPSPDCTAEMARCRELAASLGLDETIEWETAFRPPDECQRLLSECDLLVLPYDHSKESSSAALRGVLSSGVPVAVTPVTIFDEADDAVYRFATLDASSVAEGIDILLRDAQARSRLQQAASVWLAEREWGLVAQRMEGMLTGLCQIAPGVGKCQRLVSST
jgi:glycosyltransferase involved in cell wall biosynthesis